jgi:hypothetical protein
MVQVRDRLRAIHHGDDAFLLRLAISFFTGLIVPSVLLTWLIARMLVGQRIGHLLQRLPTSAAILRL